MSEQQADLRAMQKVRGPLVVGLAFMEIGKRVGLGKTFLRFALRRMFSRRLKERAFAGYTPSASDVFVATFAKSGTNWMMQIAQQIAWRGAADFDHIHQMVPWPESPGPGPVGLLKSQSLAASPTGLRVIKTHLETDFVPYDERATYLTVVRDPKEVVVSAYHFLGGILNVLTHVDMDTWYDVFMEPEGLMRAWAVHTASYWEWRQRPNVLVVSYNALKQAPRENIELVATRMGVTLEDAELARVVERASFPYMKANESQFAPPRSPFASKGAPTVMIRSGKTGASDELLSAPQQVEIDRRAREELARLGSDFPYGETFDPAEKADTAA